MEWLLQFILVVPTNMKGGMDMKVFVAGATGRVGSLLVDKLVNKGYFVYAGARNEQKIVKSEKRIPVHLDLYDNEVALQGKLAEAEAVFFVAGSRGKDLLQVDLNGAVKMMKAAEAQGIKRFILLSSAFALNPERWNEAFLKDITNYNIAKHFADSWLIQNTNLDYTILQPGALVEEKGSGKITVDVKTPRSNSIENVVDTLIAVLEEPSAMRKVIMMHDGDTTITQAIQSV